MGTLAWVAAGSLLSTSLFLFLHVVVDAARGRRLQHLELVPNCLLTRYPIVFITGRRSAFYFVNYWNQIPAFLAEHGYEVEVIDLPWRQLDRRMDALKASLVARKRPCHLIGDSSIEEELRTVSDWGLINVKSVTMVDSEDRSVRGRVSTKDLKPRMDRVAAHSLSKATGEFGAAPIASWFQALLLSLHNTLSSEASIVAPEVGLSLSGEPWIVERSFLELAISLAENDMR